MIEPIQIDVQQFIAVVTLAIEYAYATVIFIAFAAATWLIGSLILSFFLGDHE